MRAAHGMRAERCEQDEGPEQREHARAAHDEEGSDYRPRLRLRAGRRVGVPAPARVNRVRACTRARSRACARVRVRACARAFARARASVRARACACVSVVCVCLQGRERIGGSPARARIGMHPALCSMARSCRCGAWVHVGQRAYRLGGAAGWVVAWPPAATTTELATSPTPTAATASTPSSQYHSVSADAARLRSIGSSVAAAIRAECGEGVRVRDRESRARLSSAWLARAGWSGGVRLRGQRVGLANAGLRRHQIGARTRCI
jgi:hypothetical protein